MGRKLNFGHLTDEECDKIFNVIHRDLTLRQLEKERLGKLGDEVRDTADKCRVLSNHGTFNENTCIHCFCRFFIIFRRKVVCVLCGFNVCKKCSSFCERVAGYVCQACLRQRQFKLQSNDWFYSKVEKKFKRTGSEKVVRCLYRKPSIADVSDSILTAFDGRQGVAECACCGQSRMTKSQPSSDWSFTVDDVTTSEQDTMCLHGLDQGRDGKMSKASGTASLDSGIQEFRLPSNLESTDNWNGLESIITCDPISRAATYRLPGQRRISTQSTSTTDSFVQTDCPTELVETGTMTTAVGMPAMATFDGMATVSTEGQETNPAFLVRPQNIRVLEGEPIVAECTVAGSNPKDILWFCNRRSRVHQLTEEDDRCELRCHDDTFSLTVFDARKSDGLEYMCIIVNEIGQCAQGFSVTVEDNPNVMTSPEFHDASGETEIAIEGHTSTHIFTLSGYPRPRLSLVRGDLTIPTNRYRFERSGDLDYSLVIDLVQVLDSGVYSVIARNQVGESRHYFELAVLENCRKSEGSQSDMALSVDSSTRTNIPHESILEKLLRLARDVSKTQGIYASTATRMHHSAETMSSMGLQLDQMEDTLQNLEDEVHDVTSLDLDNLNNLNNNNTTIVDDLDKMKSSAEAVSMVTSAALDLLNSAKDVISAKETPEQDHRCTELQLSCQEFEKLYDEELMPWLLQQDVEDNIEMNSPRSRDLNSSGTNKDLSDSLYDSLESASKKSRKKRSSRWISEEEIQENLKKMEEKIYIASGNVFSLEECINQLEKRVEEVDENNFPENIFQLENEVAKAVAKVKQSDKNVSEIRNRVYDLTKREGNSPAVHGSNKRKLGSDVLRVDDEAFRKE